MQQNNASENVIRNEVKGELDVRIKTVEYHDLWKRTVTFKHIYFFIYLFITCLIMTTLIKQCIVLQIKIQYPKIIYVYIYIGGERAHYFILNIQ